MRHEMSGSGAPVCLFSGPFWCERTRGQVERCSRSFHHESIIRTAIATHANATYGDSRSPVYMQIEIPIKSRRGREWRIKP
jgi:hypothetical protein